MFLIDLSALQIRSASTFNPRFAYKLEWKNPWDSSTIEMTTKNIFEQHVSWILLLLAKWFKYTEIWTEF